jgi:D-amino-acid dehydrogenase
MKVVVVGAGIFGASTAYHLARAGCAVVMVERDDQGRATAAGAGIVSPWGSTVSDSAYYALLAQGARYYGQLVGMLSEDGEHDLGYAKVGCLYVPSSADELDATEQRARARAVDAPEAGSIERLSADEARKLFPPLRRDQPGLFISGGARVDGRRVAAAMQRAAVKHGAQLINGSAELVMKGQRASGVLVDGELIEADAVVATGGAWAPAFLAPAGVQLGVAPQRGQIIHLKLPDTDTARWPILQPLSSHYLLAFEDSRVVVGASRETGSGFDYRMTAAGVAEVLNAALNVAPGLASWTLHEVRIGFRPYADNQRPKIGRVPSVDNLYIGNGLGPSGLAMGPFSGMMLAQAVTGKPTAIPLDPYDVTA